MGTLSNFRPTPCPPFVRERGGKGGSAGNSAAKQWEERAEGIPAIRSDTVECADVASLSGPVGEEEEGEREGEGKRGKEEGVRRWEERGKRGGVERRSMASRC